MARIDDVEKKFKDIVESTNLTDQFFEGSGIGE